jgi:hypothetical protein
VTLALDISADFNMTYKDVYARGVEHGFNPESDDLDEATKFYVELSGAVYRWETMVMVRAMF